MYNFNTSPRVKALPLARTFRDRQEHMQEQIAQGMDRKWLVDSPEQGLRWAYGHWEVWVCIHHKRCYVGSSMDRALAVEMRALGLWYKDGILGLEAQASRTGGNMEILLLPLEKDYTTRLGELKRRVSIKNRAIRLAKREAKGTEAG